MPKALEIEARFDFRGGRNVYVSPDLLGENELRDSTNARVDTDGPITKRTGSRRLHASALAASTVIRGLVEWDGPSGVQLVAICNGDLFYRNRSAGEFAAFTQVDPGATDAFSTTEAPTFTTLRGSGANAALKLFIASGGKFYEWSGTALLRLDGQVAFLVGGTPNFGQFVPDAELVESYHIRLFANSKQRPQHLVWSKIGDGRVFKAGLAADGGTAMVSAINNEPIVALITIGRSLLIATNNSIARLAGYSVADIQIDQDTEGLSPDVGMVGRQAYHRAEHVVFFISDRGAYLASEGSVAPIGLKVNPDFEAMDRTKLSSIVVGHHHGRHEIWVAYAGSGDGGLNKTVLVWNMRHQAWYGPFTYPFGITAMSHYEDANGDEFLVAGCADGFIRHLDTGAKDDVLSDGTGGTNYNMTVEFSPIFFGHPGVTYALRYAFLRAEIPATSSVNFGTRFDDDVAFTDVAVASTTGALVNQRLDIGGQGEGLRVRITDTSDQISVIHGFVLHAHNMQRVT